MQPYQHTSKSEWTGWRRRTDRGRLRFSGADRVSFLQALVTNDVAALPVGGACDAAYLTPQGRMITDLRIYRRDEDVIVSVPAELTAALLARFDSLVFSEDVKIEDVSSSITEITLIGEGVNPLVHVLSEPPPGVPELSASDLEVARIEAGRALWGVDMNEETIPLEAGLLDRAISQTKGCYVGQEVIVRVLHRGGGRVAKRLMKVEFEPGPLDVPEAGTPIVGLDATEIGRITSAAFSSRLGRVVALGYVQRDHANPGTLITIGTSPAVLKAPAA